MPLHARLDVLGALATTYTYDATCQLRTIDHTGIGLWQYSYDAVGNRTQISTPTGTHTYSYDATDRLTSATHPAGPLEQYSYDPVGNRQTDATASYTYDAANRLLNRGGISYTWDANGNQTSKADASGTTTYRYDGDNRLLEVQRGGGTLTRFTYDPFGRRVSKITATGTVYYVYDGEDILAEVDGAGNLLTYYVHGPGIDEPLAMVRGGQTYYYHADALGTITHLTNSAGAVVQSYEYDSFGNLTAQSGSITQPYTYTAREWDAETGLYYYRARYYDPQVGRFIREDPFSLEQVLLVKRNLSEPTAEKFLALVLYNPQDLPKYLYVANNPLYWNDPTGAIAPAVAVWVCLGAGVITGGIEVFIFYIRPPNVPEPCPYPDGCIRNPPDNRPPPKFGSRPVERKSGPPPPPRPPVTCCTR